MPEILARKSRKRAGRDCLGCGVCLLPGFTRCSPCGLNNAVESGDPAKLIRFLKKERHLTDDCMPGCGAMGACHENMGPALRLLLGFKGAA